MPLQSMATAPMGQPPGVGMPMMPPTMMPIMPGGMPGGLPAPLPLPMSGADLQRGNFAPAVVTVEPPVGAFLRANAVPHFLSVRFLYL